MEVSDSRNPRLSVDTRLLRPGSLRTSVLAERAPFAHVREAATATACEAWAAGVYAGREEWIHDFDDAQFSLGRAWYTHLEQNRTAEYFAGAAASDTVVEQFCPGLQAHLRELVALTVGEPVVARRGFCGPGVHVFPAQRVAAREGGDVHYDTEGLTPAELRARVPAMTWVLMLSPPESGGGLRVWDALYEGTDEPPTDLASRRMDVAPYAAGDLVVIDSYRLHQIEPFPGLRDRISATCHAVRGSQAWELWF